MRTVRIFLMVYAMTVLVGCAATQPMIWNNSGKIDLTKGAVVSVKASCGIPSSDLSFLQTDILKKVQDVLPGKGDALDAYKIEIMITRYEEGSAFARFMLIGLGQMYLDGTVEIKQGEPPVVIRSGEFKKNYCVGGIVGGTATMQKDVLPEVGNVIADAIKAQQVN